MVGSSPTTGRPWSAEPRPELRLLKGFELGCGGRPISLPLGSQRLLAFLALHERPLVRSYVAGTLWQDATEDRSNACLRSTLWRLRNRGYPLVEATGDHVCLADQVRVDSREAATQARQVIQGTDDYRPSEVQRMLMVGDLLPDWYDDWLVIERERLRQLRLHALEALAIRLTAMGRFAEAVEAALGAVMAEPLRESAHMALIAAHLAEGNRGEALRQFRACRDLLRRELGLEPSPRLQEAVRGLGI